MQSNDDITAPNDRLEILTWLSPLEPHLRHNNIRASRMNDVGSWLLRTDEFRGWKNGSGQSESQKATIFCPGNLGVGKTYISSLVIDTLCDEPREPREDIAVACLYFDSTAQKEQSAVNVLGALLKQIISGFEQIPKEITDAFRRHKKFIGAREPQLPEIVKMLEGLSSTQPTFFCLDGLDECAAPDRAKILRSLKDIIKTSPTARVFLTGRPHVGSEVGKHLPEGVALLSISPPMSDIALFIQTKLAEDTIVDEIDEGLEAEILEKIPETFSDIFLLVSLDLDAILRETTIHRRRERLRVMTDGLDLESAYGRTLDRIWAQGGQMSRLGMTALMWICHSERPLEAEELCQALAVEIGSTDCNDNNAPSIRTVLSCCQGFIVMDMKESTIQPIHYTLQEYLTSHRNLFQSPHSTIAETCLTYLNSRQVMALSDSGIQSAQHSPFLRYSSAYWGAHMKKELTDRGKTLALKLFRHYESHISTRLLLEHTLDPEILCSIVSPYKFTGLHCASMFGLAEVVRALITMDGIDINGIDEVGATPLVWAAENGHEAAVKLLLGLGDINPDRPDCEGRTPLSYAAENGHQAVVKLLLGRKDVNPDRPDHNGQTPISWASENGHEAALKLLLERKGVNPDRIDDSDRTPIWWAAQNGHEAALKLLLGHEDVNPDKPDCDGRTPLSCAAENGHQAVVRLLLGWKDVNPDKPDHNGQTPISWASENGHEAVVKLLLGRKDVNPNRLDGWGRTPVSWAAQNGHETAVKLLLERAGVNPDKPDWNRQTPILFAAESGHEAVVKLLLGRKDVNPNRPDRNGRTPISLATENGHETMVKLLLGHKDINPNGVDIRGPPRSCILLNGAVRVEPN